jgi:hypothetical protein
VRLAQTAVVKSMFQPQCCFRQKEWGRTALPRCSTIMHDPSYYRSQAARVRRLVMVPSDRETQETLQRMAQDYLDIAVDLESGAVEIRHPELMPQKQQR